MLPPEYTLSQYDSSPRLTACTNVVILIDSSFVEEVEEYTCLNTDSGIQYKVDSSQFSSFIGLFSDDMNDL